MQHAKARMLLAAMCLYGLLCVNIPSHANEVSPLILEHLTTLDGLPQGTVMATLQDSHGFIWLGTEDGLVRFDGHDIHRYAYSKSLQDSLPGNFVNAIAEDRTGDLWLAIKGAGLARWNRASDSFTVYRHADSDANSLSSDGVRTVLVDTRGRVWAGTVDGGVNVLETATGVVRHLRRRTPIRDGLIDDRIQTLTEDRSGTIWIGTYSGLERWTLTGDHFTRGSWLTPDAAPWIGPQVMQIVEDGDNTFWIGTLDSGLYHLDRTGQILRRFSHNAADGSSLVSNDVRAILKDRTGNLWIGTEEGLDLLDRATNKFSHYQHDKADRESLTDSFIMSLYQDAIGLVWIGTRAGGVSHWDPRSWEMGAHRPKWLDGKLVTAFADAPDSKLWVGSMGGGLIQVDTRTGEWQSIDTLLKGSNVLSDSRVMSLRRDRRGNLWIGTMTSGLKVLSSDGKITSIPVAVGEPRSLSAPGIMTIYEARDGRLWIGTHGGGANVLDPLSGTVRQLPHDRGTAGATSSDNVTSFVEDNDGNMWIGTDGGGLDLAAPDGEVRAVFNHDSKVLTSLSANTIYALATDARNDIWIGTDGGGLDRVTGSAKSPSTIGFHNASRSNGLSSDTIYGILTDASGGLWLSGNSGLMRYDLLTTTVKTYHRERGLQGEEFDFGAYYRTSDGRLCFGGPSGFNVFDPASLSLPRNPPPLALTRVEVLGVPLQSSAPYWALQNIPLDYRSSIVSFDFAALDFGAPNRVQLAYRMLGLSDNWIDLGSERRVTLTNLGAGEHVLEVRASNENSSWSTTPLRLMIHKKPAPWQSTPAYTAYIVCVLVILMLPVLAHRRKLFEATAAQRRLESEVRTRTQELRDANQKLVVASEAKSAFLARIGHELRTPMNGVVGMTELLGRTPLSATQARHTQTIKSSAQTLLRILNDLLDLSKAQAGKVTLEALPVDFTRLIEECSILFSGIAESKGLELIVWPPVGDDYEVIGDPLRLRQILMNLIGNAVKFTARGEVVISCDLVRHEEGGAAVRLAVADTGIGLNSASIAKIFEPFAQADESTTRRFGGSGLGLSICQELAALMGGTISVTSELNRGSMFVVNLQLPTRVKGHPAQRAFSADTRIKLVTRRPALGESLTRYSRRCRLVSNCQTDQNLETAGTEAQVLVVDADSCGEALESCLSTTGSTRSSVIVVASAKAIQEHRLKARLRSHQLICKPVYGDTFQEHIEGAVGLSVDKMDDTCLSAEPDESARLHALIVEDDSVNAAVAQGYLSELGFTSVWVTDGETAIARQAVEQFDVILMDLNMPGLDGYATTALIRQGRASAPRIPIIALTAAGTAAHCTACIDAGMDDILSKPYTFQDFITVLQRWTPPRTTVRTPLSRIDAATVTQLRRLGNAKEADLYSRLVILFSQSSQEALTAIGTALSADDLKAAKGLSHKLKAAAANVGALEFSDGVAELERQCAAGEAGNASRVYDALKAGYPLLIDELTELRLQATA